MERFDNNKQIHPKIQTDSSQKNLNDSLTDVDLSYKMKNAN